MAIDIPRHLGHLLKQLHTGEMEFERYSLKRLGPGSEVFSPDPTIPNADAEPNA